ncbi:MAG TPA: TetR/AcrR family transcriptional regulator [Micromonosporaceae bacterium]
MDPVNGDDLTRRLIDEGSRLLAEYGPAGLSLRNVAAAAGTSTMAVYTHFGDKQGLLAAMHREGFRRLGERLRQARAQAPDSLTELGRAYRLAALESPHLYGLMFGSRPAGFAPNEADDKAADATYTPLVDGVRAAVERGVFAGDPERIALHLWVVAHGMVSLELAGLLPVAPEDAARHYEQALLLAAEPFMPPVAV